MRKVFLIGFNKCGTRSISKFFNDHGFRCAHWMKGELAELMHENIREERDPISGLERYDVFSDMISVSEDRIIDLAHRFDILHAFHPDALFVLNTRNGEDWLRSRMNHGEFVERARAALGLKDRAAVLDHWRREWHLHHLRVFDFFAGAGTGNFFVWNIDNPDFDELQRHLGIDMDPSRYGVLGSTAQNTG